MGDVLTERRRRILEFIEHHTVKFGYPPTVREIGAAVHLSSPSTVHAHLRTLEQSGYISREGLLTRAIRSLRASVNASNIISVPILGRVAAGPPILAQEEIQGYFGVPSEYVPEGRGFLLKVRGDSMIDAGINEGDYVLVREQATADNGDIVVAMLDGDATVKSFFREKDRVRLQPANKSQQAIIARDVKLVGKVIGLFRHLP